MSWYRRKSLALVAASLSAAAFLGASLGIAAAGVRNDPLVAGFNLVGGPLRGDVAPDAFLGCLPANSWTGLYIFDSPTQSWRHYLADVPAYVNAGENNGVTIVPRATGVALIMKQGVTSPHFRDTANESC